MIAVLKDHKGNFNACFEPSACRGRNVKEAWIFGSGKLANEFIITLSPPIKINKGKLHIITS